MAKPILSPSDVAKITAKIYSLPDSLRIVEADTVAADFRTWLQVNVDLTPDQITYIGTYPAVVNKFYGHLFATAFLCKGPIIFPTVPNNPAPRRIKETRANLFGQVNYDDSAKSLDSTLEINIEFSLL